MLSACVAVTGSPMFCPADVFSATERSVVASANDGCSFFADAVSIAAVSAVADLLPP